MTSGGERKIKLLTEISLLLLKTFSFFINIRSSENLTKCWCLHLLSVIMIAVLFDYLNYFIKES